MVNAFATLSCSCSVLLIITYLRDPPPLGEPDVGGLPEHGELVLEEGQDAEGLGHALGLGQQVDQQAEVASLFLK